MADIELVIKIPEEIYLSAKTEMLCGAEVIVNAIKNGTPLPKGHGRLIDADERRKEIDEEDRWVVDLADAIIEADTESEEV
jgi:hypothetical protein